MVKIIARMAWCVLFAGQVSMAQNHHTFERVAMDETRLPDILTSEKRLTLPGTMLKTEVRGPDKSFVNLSVIKTSDGRFPQCIHAETAKGFTLPWGMQIIVRPKGTFKKGDKIVATWVARNGGTRNESGEVSAEFLLQGAKVAKNGVYGTSTFSAGKDWKRFFASFEAPDRASDGDLWITFRIGIQAMKIDFAAVDLYCFPPETPLTMLPITRISYGGREADAPWRKEAAKRIEQIRKGDFQIKVVDAAGKPLPDAEVKLEMLRHAFPFGCCADEMSFGRTDPDAERMKGEFKNLFNDATVGRLTWICWWNPDPIYQTKRASCPDWLDRNGFEHWRGAHLVWGGQHLIPPPVVSNYLVHCKTSKEDARKVLCQAVKDQVARACSKYAGRVGTWVVINEAFEQKWLYEQIGYDNIPAYFRIARRIDPQARLIVNDYGILSHGGAWTEHQDSFFNLAQSIRDSGAPIDGIGFQGHSGSQLTAPDRLLAILDRFASLGLGLQVTEFDMDIPDEVAQADYLRDFFTLVFSHPAVTAIDQWGFWESDHWKPRAALWRKDWTIKPSGQAYLDLVFRDWWTKTQGKSAADGACVLRGFFGKYRVTAAQGSKVTEAIVSLTKENRTATLTLQ